MYLVSYSRVTFIFYYPKIRIRQFYHSAERNLRNVMSVITARNEVGARLCFYRCVWFCSQGAGVPDQVPPPPGPGTPPRTRYTPPGPGTPPPPDQVHPPGTREIRSTRGRYASYWNAFLLFNMFWLLIWLIVWMIYIFTLCFLCILSKGILMLPTTSKWFLEKILIEYKQVCFILNDLKEIRRNWSKCCNIHWVLLTTSN